MEHKKPLLVPVLTGIILLLLGVVISMACKSRPKDNGGGNSIGPATGGHSPFCADTGALGGYGSAKPPGMIDFNTARLLSKRYADDEGKRYIWNGLQKTAQQDARCIWFDLEKIKRFIGYIESAACRASCPDSLQLGIRIYYAKYPDAAGMRELSGLLGVPPEYADHHTVFMVPTYLDRAKKKNIDFDPQGISKGCKPMPLDPIKGLFWLGYDKDLHTIEDAQNHGSLRPPPDDTGLFPEN